MGNIRVIQVGTKKLNFLFTYRAFKFCAKEMGDVSIRGFAERIQDLRFEDIPAILYAAYENACFYQHEKVKAAYEEADTWVDELGFTKATELAASLAIEFMTNDSSEEEKPSKKKEQKMTLPKES